MKKTKLLTSVLFSAFATTSMAQSCGNVTIANMNWQSAEILANIDRLILEVGYGCKAQLISGDTVPTLTAMASKGAPDIAPEASVFQAPGVITKAIEEGSLVEVGDVLPDGYVNAWWIPAYLQEKHPEIKTIQDVLDHPELFPHPEVSKVGAVHNGPQGWGGTVATSQIYKAYQGDRHGFSLVPTGSGAALDASLIRAYERKEGWVGFYWEPSAILAKYDMVKLDSVPHNEEEWGRCTSIADCPNPEKNDWPEEIAKTLVTKKFAATGGPVLDYLSNRSISNPDINKLMAWATENQAPGEDAAMYFLLSSPEIWQAWVSEEAAEKIKKQF